MLGSDDPELLEKTAHQLVQEMEGIKEIRAPRLNGDLQRPEILIRPHMDLAADLGVTTAALSQTIRIATNGDIDQNSAKFSLSDPQIPIRVSIAEESRKNLANIHKLPVPTASDHPVPLQAVADGEDGAGPTKTDPPNQPR